MVVSMTVLISDSDISTPYESYAEDEENTYDNIPMLEDVPLPRYSGWKYFNSYFVSIYGLIFAVVYIYIF